MWDHVLEDSSVIQEFVRRGEERGVTRGVKIGEERGVKIGEERAIARLRDVLLRLGEKRFGPTDPASRLAIETLSDSDRLAALSERVLEVEGWRELLA